MSSETSGGGRGQSQPDRDERARSLTPEQDRRRDPRDDPAILDLGSLREQDGDHPEGWTDPAALSSDPGFGPGFGGAGFGGGGGGAGPSDGGDWTELIAPDLAPDPMRDAWREPGRGADPRRGRDDSARFERVVRGDDED